MKPPRSKRSSPPAQPTKPAAPTLSRRKLWLFRFAAAVLVPLFFLLLLEGGLRLAGIGHPMSFFLPMPINGKDCLVENARFGWRFFGPEMARAPFPFAISKVKTPGTIRVFVFGESAAFGDPQPEFGLSRILESLLNAHYPDKHFEVVNTAMTAINSHVILPIARDTAKQNGDVWIIYMGNNEVVGPYGSGTVFGAKAANLALIRLSLAFKATRIGQALGSLISHAQKQSVNQSEWGGMSMFQHNHVAQGDPHMARVYASFESNLHAIIEAGVHAGAKVLVSTVARNLKDCGPFASDHRTNLSAQALSEWDTIYRTGIQQQEGGHMTDAIGSFQQAIKLDDVFAEAHFRLGQCELNLGRDAEAAQQFITACDQDTLRFRADSRLNGIIRNVATNSAPASVRLVDSEAAIAAQSPHGLAGEEFFYEHVHLNFEGNYLIALTMAQQIGQALAAANTQPWPNLDECARRLAWSDFTRRKADLEILSRLNKPPFSEQANHRQQYQHLLHQIEALQPATLPDALRAETIHAKEAVSAAPDDWILRKNLARLQQQTGDTAGALESWRQVARLLPQSSETWQALGLALETAKRDSEAISAFQKATQLAPESVVSRNSLAELYVREGQTEKAVREFQQILRIKSYWGPAHLGLGKALESLGKTEEAKKEFEAALKDRIISPESFNTLAKFSFARGWYGAAATNFADALQLYPSDPETHVNLGLALDKLGRHAEARAHYAEALRLQPNFAEAHFYLGLALGQEGNAAGAQAQFAETVRLKPEFIEARLNLGIALSSQHLNQQALDQFEEVLRRDPTNQVALAQAKILRSNASAAPQAR